MMGATHIDNFPSNFWVPKYRLLLTLYVDDIVVSEGNLGREHHINRSSNETTTCSFQMRVH